MTPTTRIREIVRVKLSEMVTDPTTPLRETLLIRDGNYCGHRFTLEAANAVWFVEEDEIKFYAADGGLAQIIKPSELVAQELHACRAA